MYLKDKVDNNKWSFISRRLPRVVITWKCYILSSALLFEWFGKIQITIHLIRICILKCLSSGILSTCSYFLTSAAEQYLLEFESSLRQRFLSLFDSFTLITINVTPLYLAICYQQWSLKLFPKWFIKRNDWTLSRIVRLPTLYS